MTKPLRCYFGLHRWQRLKAEGGEGWYKQCRDCRKFKDLRGTPLIPGG